MNDKIMTEEERNQFVAEKVMEAISWCKTTGELVETMGAISYTLGSLTCQFSKDERGQIMMRLAELMARGLMMTAKGLGEPSDLEIIVGNRHVEGEEVTQ